jgi:hypothetical protein
MLTVVFIAFDNSTFDLTVDSGGDKVVALFEVQLVNGALQLHKVKDLVLGTPERFVVKSGAYSVATQNPLKYVVVSGKCEVAVNPGKDPWPTPPPMPSTFKGAVADKAWETFFNKEAAANFSNQTPVEVQLVTRLVPRGEPVPETIRVE